jgi:hypothetical protein
MHDKKICDWWYGWGALATLLQQHGLPHPCVALLVVIIDDDDIEAMN